MVNLDMIISIGVFLIFVSIAFSLYLQLFQAAETPLDAAAQEAADKVLDFVLVDVREVSMNYSNFSENEQTNKVLFINYTWEFGQNTTQVYQNGTSTPLTCNISGANLHWRSPTSNTTGNFYVMRYTNQTNITNRCNATFDVVNISRVFPGGEEKLRWFSNSRKTELNTTGYGKFKGDSRINRDFKVEFNESGTINTFGLNPPPVSPVKVVERVSQAEETGNNVRIRIFVW